MRHLISKSWGLLLATLIMPHESFADSWTCHYQELTRSVTIFYPSAPSKLPCKVYYAKPNENVIPRTLWKAEHEENYCQRKAVGFIEKLESLGWQCSIDNE